MFVSMSSVTRNLSADSLMAFSPVAEPFKKKQEKKFTISIHLKALRRPGQKSWSEIVTP